LESLDDTFDSCFSADAHRVELFLTEYWDHQIN